MAQADSSKSGLLVVISGPSGAGKTTIARAVECQLGGEFSVSATTRPKAPADVEGRDYFFLTDAEFQGRVERGEMLEYAQVFGKHWYGTPKAAVEAALEGGRLMILEIDVQGGMQVRRAMPHALLLFIEPPTEQELLARLRARGRDSEETILHRYSQARKEIATAKASNAYDRFITNHQIDRAVAEVCAAIGDRWRQSKADDRGKPRD